MKNIKIQIIKCSAAHYWYKNNIGKIYDMYDNGVQYTVNESGDGNAILKSDAVKVCCDTCVRDGSRQEPACCNCNNDFNNWYYKEAEPKVEDIENYVPEICQMFGLEWNAEKAISQKFEIDAYKGTYQITGGSIDCVDDKGKINSSYRAVLNDLIFGVIHIKPIIEFAKPVWCENNGEQYLTIDSSGNRYLTSFVPKAIDYYRRAHGNMFEPESIIPQEQRDQLVSEMKCDNRKGTSDGD